MSKSHLSVVTYRCARCRAEKPAIEFNPLAEDGILLRSDSCVPCCREIAAIRRELGGRNGKNRGQR
jgi:hypothetical protein